MKKIILCDDGKVEEVSKLAKERGYGIEIQAFHDSDRLPDNAFQTHGTALEGIGLRSLHGPFGDLNPGSHDAKVRAVTLERFEEGYAAARKLKISNIVFHSGFVPKTRPKTGWMRQSIGFWRDFASTKPETAFHIENMLDPGPEILAELIDGIALPNVDACLDIGHAHCNSKRSVTEWVEHLGKRIGYVHIHDNHGEDDEHLGLGEGNMEIKGVFQALDKYSRDAIWAIEAEGEGLLKSVDCLKDNKFI